MLPEVMTVEQLAKYLQLDEQTVYRKARTGQIPTVRIGRVLRFKKDIVDGWLRLSSLEWNSQKRNRLRTWTSRFAKMKKLSEEKLQRTISKRRHNP